MILIVDGHHFFSRSLFASMGFDKNRKTLYLSSEKEQIDFIQKVSVDIFSQIKTLKPSGVIWTFDNKSWRKNLHLNPIVQEKMTELHFDYKSNRDYSDSPIDWAKYSSLIDEFCQLLHNKGFLVVRQAGLEGDDLCLILSRRVMAAGKNAMIMSADGDLRTLVSLEKDQYTVCFNPVIKDRKLFVPIGFNAWFDKKDSEVTLFNMNFEVNPISYFKPQDVIEVDVIKMAFFKIFLGKSNEAIPPVWEWKTTTGEPRKISEKMVTEVWNQIITSNLGFKIEDLEDETYRLEISRILYLVVNKKIKVLSDTDKVNISSISKNLLANYYFKYLTTKFVSEKLLEFPMTVNLQTKIIKNHINEMLEGTRFAKKTQTTAGIFDLLPK